MSRSGRLGILLVLFGLILAAVGIFVVINIVNRSLAPLPAPTAAPPVTEKVVVTTHDMAAGAVLREGDIALLDVPVELIPVSAMRQVDEVVGRLSKIPMVSGEMVLPHHLADPTNVQHDLAFVLGDDQVLMAFPADDLLSSLNLLQPGDLVDILASFEVPVQTAALVVGPEEDQEQEEQLFTFNALQRVTISATIVEITQDGRAQDAGLIPAGEGGTPAPTPTPAPSQIQSRAILIALAPQDALTLKHLKDAGAIIDIVLRAPTSTQNFELDPVMDEYLIDRFGLEVPR